MNPILPPPLLVMMLGTLMWAVDRALPVTKIYSTLLAPLAVVLLIAGLLLMFAAAASFFIARTTINPLRPSRASHLITSGVFRLSRNPIYLGDLLLLAALATWLGNIFNLLFLFGFLWLIQRYQIAPEERALTRLFGESYRAYCAQVRRWL